MYGLPKGHNVAELNTGDEVIVQCSETEKGHIAYLRRLSNEPPVMAADATVVRFDRKHKEVVLDLAKGESDRPNANRETFQISKHASIQEGLMVIPYSKLSLTQGDPVTVYYTDHGGERTIDAMVDRGSSSSSGL